MKQLIFNAHIVNEGRIMKGAVLIDGEYIEKVFSDGELVEVDSSTEKIDAEGLWLMPGVIDDQVHFREPGLTYKGDIFTESRAAVAGGVTSYMEMPNTRPQTTTFELLEEKFALAASKSLANYSFYMGATNTNIRELTKVNPREVCGIKVFMGSSTGNMLVNDIDALNRIFDESPTLIATHCEDEEIIHRNLQYYKSMYSDSIGVEFHPLIRSEEACFKSSSYAVELAHKHNSRLHILHLSTAAELVLFNENTPLKDKLITAEACVHHLWFSDRDYAALGNKIKWNPAIKKESDRQTLIDAVNSNKIDVVATDHAPHTWEEKQGNCYEAYSGGPLVQHSLTAMLQLAKQGYFTVEKVVEKMCHAPADLFRIENRGYIRPGYFADLVLVDPSLSQQVTTENILYKCGWSPFEGETFDSVVVRTFVNGQTVFNNGVFDENIRGKRLIFNV